MIRQHAMAIIAILVIGVNGAWYAAKVFLHARGVPVGWFSGHFRDLTSLRELAERSPDPAEQGRARALLWVLRGAIAVFLLVSLFVLGTIGRHE
jgi:hypothetical protein